ncbi:glycosyltransferase family 4 protein [Terrihabitans sp. B22-R8]|uniref:glycosyltransferase family 4 protein n=1 Tax=Terrihabitans sp. B22-R8 TaxID=3425128 RepID=UPI00403D0508
MLGALPPPIMGLAVANAAMMDAFKAAGAHVLPIDTAPRPTRAGRWAQLRARSSVRLLSLVTMLRHTLSARDCVVYCGLSGGWGQLLDLAALLIPRIAGRPIVLHHHNFTYIDRRSALSSLAFTMLGRGTRHIVLCQSMAHRLQALYPSIRKVDVLSNAAWIDKSPGLPSFGRPFGRIGFLSNITLEKGIARFIRLLEELRRRGYEIRGLVAGPLVQDEAAALVRRAEAAGLLDHVGPVVGEPKNSFLRSIDAFVLPTSYANEAEPIVIHEALAAGVPVIASRRGCIGSLIDGDHGCLLDADGTDLGPALQAIETWIAQPDALDRARLAALERANDLRSAASDVRRILVQEILGEVCR